MNEVLAIPGVCAGCPIRGRAVCSRCDVSELRELEAIRFYREYEAGQTVACRGDEMQTVSSVLSGTATMTRVMEDGRTQIVGLLFPSDFIGRLGRNRQQHDVVAVSDVTLCCFRKAPFEALVARSSHISTQLLQMSLDALDEARDWMLLLGRKTAREKVASFLLLIRRRMARSGSELRLELPLTREVMATYLGLTIETVSRQITGLRRDGLIAVEGKRVILIRDLPALMAAAGEDEVGDPLD
jgi:CRP/FNR family transcriptional regulator